MSILDMISNNNGEAPIMLEVLGMLNTLSLPLLPGPLSPEVVAKLRLLARILLFKPKSLTHSGVNWPLVDCLLFLFFFLLIFNFL